MTRPSELRIPVGYPNADPANGAGMGQADFTGKYLINIAALRQRDTFRLLEPEFQRRYLAMAAAAWVEAGLLLGVGTGWRSEKEQAANHLKWPNQFAPVSASNHMRKAPYDVAYAIDSVPYDALGWAHSNCARFGINYLDHIPNERHHCQPIEFPNSGTAYWVDPRGYADAAAVVLDLPYLGFSSVDDWLAADAPLSLVPPPPDPEPTPTPDPEPPPTTEEDDDMPLFIAKYKSGGTDDAPTYTVVIGDGLDSNLITVANEFDQIEDVIDAGHSRWHDPLTGDLVMSRAAIPVLYPKRATALVGKPR